MLKLVETADGSHSLYNDSLDEHYHSKHGAMQEALHVFIKMGLNELADKPEISVLEIGFGTGLNAFLTYLRKPENQTIHYTGLETYPLDLKVIEQLNYFNEESAEHQVLYKNMHALGWTQKHPLASGFYVQKLEQKVQEVNFENEFDLIYFDAFGPRVQPDMWSDAVFQKMYKALKTNGFLVTYCAQGEVKRAMKRSGFVVERLAGPPGKREMTKALKL